MDHNNFHILFILQIESIHTPRTSTIKYLYGIYFLLWENDDLRNTINYVQCPLFLQYIKKQQYQHTPFPQKNKISYISIEKWFFRWFWCYTSICVHVYSIGGYTNVIERKFHRHLSDKLIDIKGSSRSNPFDLVCSYLYINFRSNDIIYYFASLFNTSHFIGFLDVICEWRLKGGRASHLFLTISII